MSDSTKILLGTTAGFLMGLLAEPIKFSMGNWLKRRQARRILYSEFARILVALDRFQDIALKVVDGENLDDQETAKAQEAADRFKMVLSTDLFDYYYEKEKILYYDTDDASQLRAFYMNIKKESVEITASSATLKDQIIEFGVCGRQLLLAGELTQESTKGCCNYSSVSRS